MCANLKSDQSAPREGYIRVRVTQGGDAQLYYREVGQGQPVIVLHGGMDLDHTYLLPDMDRLSDSYRLIYYDQRGRGKSDGNVQPEDVTIESEIEDLERLREYFGLESVAVLGHSWGGLLALEYAIRHPQCVSHLILMNTAPVSHDHFLLYTQEWGRRRVPHEEKLQALRTSARYKEGDPEAVAELWRIYFSTTIKQPEHLNRVNLSLPSFTKESVLRGRAIADRLSDQTWLRKEYNLIPQLKQLSNPTLVIHGDYDFVPVEVAADIAQAMPRARLVVLEDCGHLSYLERPVEFLRVIRDFFRGT